MELLMRNLNKLKGNEKVIPNQKEQNLELIMKML